MKTKYIFLYCLLFICNAVTAQKVITGAEQMDRLLPILKGKRVALVVNQTSKVGETHLLDTLLAAHIQIKKVFAPEHGFRGDADAGETIRNGKDTRTGIPILSLYGKNKKPTGHRPDCVRHSGCRCPFLYLYQHHAVCNGSLCREPETTGHHRPAQSL